MRPTLTTFPVIAVIWYCYVLEAKTQLPIRAHTTASDSLFAKLSTPETKLTLSASTVPGDQLLFAVLQGFSGKKFNITAVKKARELIKARESVAGLIELAVPGSVKHVRLSTIVEIAWRTLRSENTQNTIRDHLRVFRGLYLDCLRKGMNTSRKDPWGIVPVSRRPTTLALEDGDGVLFAELIRAGHKVVECDYLMGVVSMTVVGTSFLAKRIYSAAVLGRHLQELGRFDMMRDHFESIFPSISLEIEKQLRVTAPVFGKLLDGEAITDTDLTYRGLLLARDEAVGFLFKTLIGSKSFDRHCLLEQFLPHDGTIFHRAAREGLSSVFREVRLALQRARRNSSRKKKKKKKKHRRRDFLNMKAEVAKALALPVTTGMCVRACVSFVSNASLSVGIHSHQSDIQLRLQALHHLSFTLPFTHWQTIPLLLIRFVVGVSHRRHFLREILSGVARAHPTRTNGFRKRRPRGLPARQVRKLPPRVRRPCCGRRRSSADGRCEQTVRKRNPGHVCADRFARTIGNFSRPEQDRY